MIIKKKDTYLYIILYIYLRCYIIYSCFVKIIRRKKVNAKEDGEIIYEYDIIEKDR